MVWISTRGENQFPSVLYQHARASGGRRRVRGAGVRRLDRTNWPQLFVDLSTFPRTRAVGLWRESPPHRSPKESPDCGWSRAGRSLGSSGLVTCRVNPASAARWRSSSAPNPVTATRMASSRPGSRRRPPRSRPSPAWRCPGKLTRVEMTGRSPVQRGRRAPSVHHGHRREAAVAGGQTCTTRISHVRRVEGRLRRIAGARSTIPSAST
jgi:hypothetical protein